MRPFDPDVLDALDANEIVKRGLVLIDLPSGLYGFWDGTIDFVHGGATYKPGGQILEIEQIDTSSGLEAESLNISLSSIPNSDLTPDVLATIYEETYVGRPVTLSIAYFTPDGVLINVERIRRYYIDTFDLVDEPGDEDNVGVTKLVMRLESKALDHQRRGQRVRSSADQARISPGDQFFDHVAVTAQQDIFWGRLPEKAVR